MAQVDGAWARALSTQWDNPTLSVGSKEGTQSVSQCSRSAKTWVTPAVTPQGEASKTLVWAGCEGDLEPDPTATGMEVRKTKLELNISSGNC